MTANHNNCPYKHCLRRETNLETHAYSLSRVSSVLKSLLGNLHIVHSVISMLNCAAYKVSMKRERKGQMIIVM